MHSGTSRPESLASEEQASTQRNKRRHPSEPSGTSSPVEQPNAAPAMPSTQRASMRTSSRDETPPDGSAAVRYTRTGRVSRANKGQRVHECEECGKTYTRAEHLRRHQQNHEPGTFPCDIPGCQRSFFREDLLVRHKMRHNDPSNTSSSNASPGSQAPVPSVDTSTQLLLPGAATAPPVGENLGPQENIVAPQRWLGGGDSQQHANSAQFRKALPFAPRHQHLRASVLSGSEGGLESSGYNSDASSVVSSLYGPPPTSNVDVSQYYSQRARNYSNDSGLEYGPPASLSPQVALSHPLPWDPTPSLDLAPTDFASFPSLQGPYFNVDTPCEPELADQTNSIYHYRDREERSELLVHSTIPEAGSFDMSLDGPTSATEHHYLRAYWMWVHSFFPIVHAPLFDRFNCPPLLKAAILALGANAEGSAQGKYYARAVHERCIKILQKRTAKDLHTYEICDMQAIVLIEIYSIFKSRRPPLELSKHFESVAGKLTQTDGIWENIKFPASNPNGPHPDLFYEVDMFSNLFDLECKQRLLASCYIIDQQHALLFGRPRIVCLVDSGVEIPTPRPQTSWEAQEAQQAPEQFFVDSGWPTPDEGFTTSRSTDDSVDTFGEMFSLALFIDSNKPSASSASASRLARDLSVKDSSQQSSRMQMAYHTLMLCERTPVRDLLAVAGESWIMSDKLASRTEHTIAQLSSREWAQDATQRSRRSTRGGDGPSVHEAVYHALQILDIHQSHGGTGLLFHEWSLHLASLVLWARAYIVSIDSIQDPRSDSLETATTSKELEQTVSAAVREGATAPFSLGASRRILLWTKNCIQAVDLLHHCGLTNGAVDVLGRLVARGEEVGWFG